MSIPAGFDVKLAHVAAEWPHDRPLVTCRFDPTGKYVFCGAEDALVQRYALADGARTLLAGGHESWVYALAFSKDGATAISGGADGKIAWWEAAAEKPAPVRSIEGHKGWTRTLAVSPDGAHLASGGNDGMVRLWNVADGKPVSELAGHGRPVYSVAFHPQGKFLLSGDLMGVVKQWDLASGKEVRAFDAAPLHTYEGGQRVDYGGVRGLTVSPDEKWLAAGGLYKGSNPLGAVNEPLVLLFNWESQKIERQQIAEGLTQATLRGLTWVADGSLMGMSVGPSGSHLLFWKPDADKDYFRFALPGIARYADLHPDGLQVATACFDRKVRIIRLAAAPAPPPAKPA
jgi:WD40 repeat protein